MSTIPPPILPITTLTPEYYQEITETLQQNGLPTGTTPILRVTPYGDLVCYLKEEIYMHQWDQYGTTYYYPISLGYYAIPVYFRPNPNVPFPTI